MTAVETILEPLVARRLFASAEEAAQKLVRDYVLRQIISCRDRIVALEHKYGMDFGRFTQYTSERTALLRRSTDLLPEQRQSLARAVMQEEDDWLDWKATEELLQSWLGLQTEA